MLKHDSKKDLEKALDLIEELENALLTIERMAEGLASRGMGTQADEAAIRDFRDDVETVIALVRGDQDSDPVDPTDVERYPTPEEISELPDRIRHYIHDLETRCDPAGDLRRLETEKQKRRELEAEMERLRDQIGSALNWIDQRREEGFRSHEAETLANIIEATFDDWIKQGAHDTKEDSKSAHEVYHDDVHALLEALGLGTHARPESPHEVVHSEVLPAIKRLQGAVQRLIEEIAKISRGEHADSHVAQSIAQQAIDAIHPRVFDYIADDGGGPNDDA